MRSNTTKRVAHSTVTLQVLGSVGDPNWVRLGIVLATTYV